MEKHTSSPWLLDSFPNICKNWINVKTWYINFTHVGFHRNCSNRSQFCEKWKKHISSPWLKDNFPNICKNWINVKTWYINFSHVGFQRNGFDRSQFYEKWKKTYFLPLANGQFSHFLYDLEKCEDLIHQFFTRRISKKWF